MERRRGRFSYKEHRTLLVMISRGVSVDELVEEFRTSKEMILQKAAELGVQLKRPAIKRSVPTASNRPR